MTSITFPPTFLATVAQTLGLPDEAAAHDLLTTYAPRDAWEARQAAKAAALDAVLMNACQRALEPGLPHALAARLHRSIAALERASRAVTAALEQRQAQPLAENSDQNPIHRDSLAAGPPLASNVAAQHPMQPEDDTVPPWVSLCRTQEEIDSERLSAWRNDHTDPRDRQAHERLKIVLEDRLTGSAARARAEARRLARIAAGGDTTPCAVSGCSFVEAPTVMIPDRAA